MRVLLVEDDEELLASVKKGLERPGYAVDGASDGESGLAAAQSDTYDIIILDWMLPDYSGEHICKELRRQRVATPILLLTALADVKHRVAGLDAGADDYLSKPFAFDELLARLRALGRRAPIIAPSILSVRDLTLDTNRRIAVRSDMEIVLSGKEFALLELFMRHPGFIYSRDTLVERVWNEEADTLSSTVETYISYLRAKIDKPFSHRPKLIHTVWGQGYTIK
jgi:two-component system, OmpR family, response regulator